MGWVWFDDTCPEWLVAAGPLAVAMHAAALRYCSRHEVPGVLRPDVAALVDLSAVRVTAWTEGEGEVTGTPTPARWEMVAEELVFAGLWAECDAGYLVYDSPVNRAYERAKR